MPEVERLGTLVDAPAPCFHKNVNPFIVERVMGNKTRNVGMTTVLPDRVAVRCPVEGCGHIWYLIDPYAAYRD